MDPDNISLGFERVLNFTTGAQTHTGKLIISRIQFVPERKCWACYWSLDFIKSNESRLYGNDPLDCLLSVLSMASKLIKNSGYPDLEVWWKQKGDYGGLPEIDDSLYKNRYAPPLIDKGENPS